MATITELLQTHLGPLQSPWLLAVVAVATAVLVSGLGARLVDLWDALR